MKTPAFLLLAAFLPFVAWAGSLDRPTASPAPGVGKIDVNAIKTFTVKELAAKAPSMVGQIVKIKFSYVSNVRPGEAEGDTMANLEDKSFFSFSVRARVPKDGANWLSKLPSDYSTTRTSFAYGRIDKTETGGYYSQVTILGREIHTDMKGVSTINW